MKTRFLFLVYFLCVYSNFSQIREIKQITNDSLNYDNPSMPLQPMNMAYSIPSFLLSEIKQEQSINIAMLTYDNLTDSFSEPIFITDDKYINRNAVAAEPSWGRDGLIIWESNKSGNFDIYYKTKSETDENWSETKVLLSSPDDEINPRLSYNMYWENLFAFTFEKNGNLYFAQYQDSLFNLIEVFTSKDGVYYHNTQSFVNGDNRVIVICEKSTADSKTKIVMKAINSNLISDETLLYENVIAYNSHRGNWADAAFFVSYLDGGEIKQKLIDLYYQSNNQYSYFDFDLEIEGEIEYFDGLLVPIIGRENNPYHPFVYRYKYKDSLYIKVAESQSEYDYYHQTLSIPLKHKESKPAIGGFFILNGHLTYAIWADSVENRTQLFGVKRFDIYGNVDENINPNEIYLSQNYPNPFNPTTSIEYAVPSSEYVTLRVYDILGNEVATLVNEQKSAGVYSVIFNAENLPSGVYIYQLRRENYNTTKKMLLLK